MKLFGSLHCKVSPRIVLATGITESRGFPSLSSVFSCVGFIRKLHVLTPSSCRLLPSSLLIASAEKHMPSLPTVLFKVLLCCCWLHLGHMPIPKLWPGECNTLICQDLSTCYSLERRGLSGKVSYSKACGSRVGVGLASLRKNRVLHSKITDAY